MARRQIRPRADDHSLYRTRQLFLRSVIDIERFGVALEHDRGHRPDKSPGRTNGARQRYQDNAPTRISVAVLRPWRPTSVPVLRTSSNVLGRRAVATPIFANVSFVKNSGRLGVQIRRTVKGSSWPPSAIYAPNSARLQPTNIH